ncbi:MAG TPA: lipoate--protein ligase family protein [Planctomycetaceae bacterium]|nr:lipoate--protein ligase family protein [Planctomycetaceae bacterium]
MLLLDLTLDSAAANVALDEALLTWAESQEDGEDNEILRLWECQTPAVIIGRSSRVGSEVFVERCRDSGVPIIRRCSGGAAIVVGPGCLMYAVVLDIVKSPHLAMIDSAHQFVLERLAQAIRRTAVPVEVEGHSDLTTRGRKFSGNSLRVTRSQVLYHGTILYDFDLNLVPRYLCEPPRQPDYRDRRHHREFICNVSASPAALRQALVEQWQARADLETWPQSQTDELLEQKYSVDSWNFSR